MNKCVVTIKDICIPPISQICEERNPLSTKWVVAALYRKEKQNESLEHAERKEFSFGERQHECEE